MELCNRCHRLRQCCAQCHCCPHCCCCQCGQSCSCAGFTAVKRSLTTGAPLAWASYTLYQNGRPLAAAVSDAAGKLRFSCLSPGIYDLVETAAPAGYEPDPDSHRVAVEADGSVTIDGQPAEGAPLYNTPLAVLSFRKLDGVSGRPVAGAVFTLSSGLAAASSASGLVDFGALAPGSYTMTETAAPPGYLPDSRVYQITVLEDHQITVDGVTLSGFSVHNVPQPVFAFRKYNAASGQPLAGAVFSLDGRSVTSDSGGLVNFEALAPGTYTMTETAAPSGFEPNTAVYTVAVDSSGEITVDGRPAFGFSVSNTPSAAQEPGA